jgi:hypothetical protein
MDEDRDVIDTALFQRDIEDVLGVHADFLTDGLLGKPGVSPDLLTARRPLGAALRRSARIGGRCSKSTLCSCTSFASVMASRFG